VGGRRNRSSRSVRSTACNLLRRRAARSRAKPLARSEPSGPSEPRRETTSTAWKATLTWITVAYHCTRKLAADRKSARISSRVRLVHEIAKRLGVKRESFPPVKRLADACLIKRQDEANCVGLLVHLLDADRPVAVDSKIPQ